VKVDALSERVGELFWLIFRILILGAVLVAVAVQGFHYVKFVIRGGI